MSKVLRTSGYVALTIQMLWGMYNVFLLAPGGPDITSALVGGHAHFGVLSILAVVTGLAIERTTLSGTARSVAVWGFVVGQWLLPATVLAEVFAPMLLITAYLWGRCSPSRRDSWPGGRSPRTRAARAFSEDGRERTRREPLAASGVENEPGSPD